MLFRKLNILGLGYCATTYDNIKLKDERLKISDYAFRKHAFRAMKVGRGVKHFLEGELKIVTEGAENAYKRTARI